MRSFIKFLLVVIAIVVLSAFLAPLLFRFLPFKFERIFNRLIMIFTLVALALFLRVRRETLVSYGIAWRKESLYYVMAAFLAGFGVLSLMTLFKLMTGQAVWAPQALQLWEWPVRLISYLGAALLIGVIEEFFFRGFVFSTFRRQFAWNIAVSVVVTSIFYSLIHFVSHEKPYIGPEPGVMDSFRLVAAPFLSLSGITEYWPAALGLFLFGVILNDLVIRAGSLYPAIGLHAGCVFFVKLDGLFVDFLDTNTLIWAGKKMYDGAIGWVFLLVLAGILKIIVRSGTSPRNLTGEKL